MEEKIKHETFSQKFYRKATVVQALKDKPTWGLSILCNERECYNRSYVENGDEGGSNAGLQSAKESI